ncbi:hypothetical protein BDQ17DRAFT_1246375 [Cyathus striatus]|nr:hypothetical protein BDQ17DRAFT_1246375 [Cyathus striatus]
MLSTQICTDLYRFHTDPKIPYGIRTDLYGFCADLCRSVQTSRGSVNYCNLGNTYRYLGEWKEAEELEVQVLEMRTRTLSQEHPHTLSSMANLANTYRNLGKWKKQKNWTCKY